MSLILFHNARCSKSRAAFDLLQEKGAKFQVRRYLDEPLSHAELTELLEQLGAGPHDLVRKSEVAYRKTDLPQASDAELLEAMVANPLLIERPVLTNGTKAVIGRPPEKVLELI